MNAARALAFCGIAGVLSFAGTPAAAADEPKKATCGLFRDETLDMTLLPSGGIAIPVTLNDRQLLLEVDTGSDASSITDETADELSLRRKYTNNGGAFLNNITIAQYARLDGVGLGRLHSRGTWNVLVIPNTLTDPTNAGLLGSDVLRNYDVEFDFYGGKMNLFEHNTCPTPVYWTKTAFAKVPMTLDGSGHIQVEATLDGKPVSLLFDTGAPLSTMSVDAAREMFGWAERDPRLKSLGTIPINGGVQTPLYSFPFESLNFEGVAVAHPNIQLMPDKNFMASNRGPAQIVLGMTVLRQLHLYVAYDEKNLYLTDAEAR